MIGRAPIRTRFPYTTLFRSDQDNDVRPPQRGDFPHVGAVLGRLKGAPRGLPGFVAIPELAVRSSTQGEVKRARTPLRGGGGGRSEEHTSELQSHSELVCRLL